MVFASLLKSELDIQTVFHPWLKKLRPPRLRGENPRPKMVVYGRPSAVKSIRSAPENETYRMIDTLSLKTRFLSKASIPPHIHAGSTLSWNSRISPFQKNYFCNRSNPHFPLQ
jgi:hypothetical protein